MVRIGERHMWCVEGIAGVPMWHAEGRESYVVCRGGRVVCGASRGGQAQEGESRRMRCAEGRGYSRRMRRAEGRGNKRHMRCAEGRAEVRRGERV